MAEGVIIEGIGGGLEGWASNKTIKDLNDTIKKLNESVDKSNKAKAANDKADTKAYKELDESLRDVGESAKDASSELDKIGKSNFRQVVENTLGLITKAAGAVYGVVDMSNDAVYNLSASGFTLSNAFKDSAGSIKGLDDVTQSMGLTTKHLIELQKTYGATINRVGIAQFTKWSRNLRSTFNELSISTGEAAELMAIYKDNQAGYSYNLNISHQAQQAALHESMTSLERWSKTLGVSRTELAKSINQLSKDPFVKALRSKLENLGPQFIQSFDNIMSQWGGADTESGKNIAHAISGEYIEASGFWQMLSKTGQHAAAATLAEMHKTKSIDPARFEELNKILMSQLANADQQNKHLQVLGRDNSDAVAVLTAMQESNSIQARIEKTSGGRLTDEQSKSSAVFQSGKDQLSATTQGLALKAHKELVDEVNVVLTKSNEVYKSVATEIKKTTVDADGYISSLLNRVVGPEGLFSTDTVAEMSKWIIGIGAAVGAIKAVTSGTSLASSIFGTDSKTTGSKGGAIGKLGTGIGAGITGLSTGLSVAGRQAVPIVAGGAAIAAAIAVIGVAVGAATWAIGEGVGSFADNLDRFTEIDSDKLSKVGSAVGDLGAGMLSMSGLTVANILENITKLFGGDTVLDNLQNVAYATSEFAPQLNTASESVQSYATSIGSLADAFIKLNRNLPNKGIGFPVVDPTAVNAMEKSNTKTANTVATYANKNSDITNVLSDVANKINTTNELLRESISETRALKLKLGAQTKVIKDNV